SSGMVSSGPSGRARPFESTAHPILLMATAPRPNCLMNFRRLRQTSSGVTSRSGDCHSGLSMTLAIEVAAPVRREAAMCEEYFTSDSYLTLRPPFLDATRHVDINPVQRRSEVPALRLGGVAKVLLDGGEPSDESRHFSTSTIEIVFGQG